MRSFLASALAFALAALVISPSPAQAQDATSRQEAARAAGEEGLKLFTSGRWQEALEMFERAESEFHAVTLVLYMARCQRMRGKLVEARALYEQITGEALGPNAPGQFRTAQTQARGELERLRRRIPSLVLAIKGAPASRVHVTVDGAPVRVSE
ncbi:MAG: tetratricopeptide repeat protein, partial [Byssovorax sp.]